MNIIKMQIIDSCFKENDTYEIFINEPISYKFIQYLGEDKNFQYFPNFPKPFFKITDKNFIIKGVEGNNNLRVIFLENIEISSNLLIQKIMNY